MHDYGHAAFDPIDDLLRHFFALVDLHHHSLAMGAQREKSMHTRVKIEIDDCVGGLVIDSAVTFERHRHWHQDAFDGSVACHECSFRKNNLSLSIAHPILECYRYDSAKKDVKSWENS